MLCTSANVTVSGGFYSAESLSFEVRLEPCFGRNSCQNESDINAYLDEKTIVTLMTDTYIDAVEDSVLKTHTKEASYYIDTKVSK